MDSGWSGFSDEDLKRLKQSSSDNVKASERNVLKDASRPQRPTQSRKPNPKPIASRKQTEDVDQALLPDQRLSVSSTAASVTGSSSKGSQSKADGEKKKPVIPAESGKQNHESTGTGVVKFPNEAVQTDAVRPQEIIAENKSGETELILDEEFILKHEIADLEKFREHQKMMEEQNKKKKEMLIGAIHERQKRAKAEATKLTIIKKELDRLDLMVNADVSVIRNKIEEISRDFLEAQKRYTRAEHEFVEAKVDLHKKSQLKEQLTEHLYTIIHQNEQRKAKKLSELMTKLEMEGSDEVGAPDDDVQPPPVPICHISPTEPRKGCLQSLGLSLITSQPTSIAPGGAGHSTDLPAEQKNSESVPEAAAVSVQSEPASAVNVAASVNRSDAESSATNVKTDSADIPRTMSQENSVQSVDRSEREKTEVVESTK